MGQGRSRVGWPTKILGDGRFVDVSGCVIDMQTQTVHKVFALWIPSLGEGAPASAGLHMVRKVWFGPSGPTHALLVTR